MREKWHKATAMIVESHDNPPDAVGPAFHVSADVHEYVIEVVGPQGPRRVTVAMFSRFVHEAGALIYVEISGKTGEVKVDHDAMSEVAVQLMKDHPEAAPGYARRRQLPDESPASTSPVLFPSGPPAAPIVQSSFSAFDTDGGDGPPEQRIAMLKQLLDKGILTESEFNAKRRQILGLS